MADADGGEINGNDREENRSTMEREQETGEVVDGKEKRMNRDTVMENSGEKNKDKKRNKRGLAWKIIYQNIRNVNNIHHLLI